MVNAIHTVLVCMVYIRQYGSKQLLYLTGSRNIIQCNARLAINVTRYCGCIPMHVYMYGVLPVYRDALLHIILFE